jgi:hypothetical protein
MSKEMYPINLELTIKPLRCSKYNYGPVCTEEGEQVKVYNKIRENLIFEVFSKLTIEGVVIDSVDSILPRGTPCLSEYTQCCKVDYMNNSYPSVHDFDVNNP